MIHFKTDSYPMQINKITCDKEIGSVKNGWHACNKKALFQYETKCSNGMYLHYCERHAPKSAETIKC